MEVNQEYSRIARIQEVNPAVVYGSSLLNINRRPDKTSAKYTEIDDLALVEMLNQQNWFVTDYSQVKPHKAENSQYVPYLATLTNSAYKRAEEAFSILLRSARDGTKCLQIDAGIFKFACANGLIIGESMIPGVKLKHKGAVQDDLLSLLDTMVTDRIPAVYNTVDEMKAKELTDSQKRDFAKEGLVLRFGEGEASNVKVDDILTVKRDADTKDDLFTTFNIVQESLLRGKSFTKKTAKGKDRKVKALSNIDRAVTLNKGLWTLAEGYLQ